MPLEPTISPRIELNRRDPLVVLVRDEEMFCAECRDHYFLDEEGKDRVCVVCVLNKSGKSSIQLFGWTIQKTTHQVIAQPPKHRMDGK